MKVAVTGSSGTVGRALLDQLRSDGHEVVALVRRDPRAAGELRWDPSLGAAAVDQALRSGLAGVDGVINLAGAGVGDKRWSDDYKNLLVQSRVTATQAITTAMAALDPRPRVLVQGSAYGWYGDTGDTITDETGSAGTTFLARLAQAWEQSAQPAVDAGIRVAYARTGLVVSADGGAWGRTLPMFKVGAGGRLGSGKQWWPFVSLADESSALMHLLSDDSCSGAYNLTAPNPCTNAEATQALGALLHRPTFAAVPAFAVRAAIGEFADEVLNSRRVVPARLTAQGFAFQHPTIEQALAAMLAP